MFNVEKIRADFPILLQKVGGKPLVYLDNAASKQKPKVVIDAVSHFYENDYANVHRGNHTLSARATEMYESARAKAATFINAAATEEIIFTKGATESINLVAHSFINKGDGVLLTQMEHHANIVPWQLAGAKIHVVKITSTGEIDLEHFATTLKKNNIKLAAFAHISNALGTINDVGELTQLAKNAGAAVLIDGCQAVAHVPADVQDIGCDFYVFSGHKMYGPTGVGVLWGRQELLEGMPPYQGGGEMIDRVTFEKTTWADLPNKFEAGTPPIVQVIGLGAAIDYLNALDREAAHAYEQKLLVYATDQLRQVNGLTIWGMAENKVPILSFTMEEAHHGDIADIINNEGVAVRAGHHCAQPLMDHFGIPGTARASLTFYNTKEEVDQLISALATVRQLFAA